MTRNLSTPPNSARASLKYTRNDVVPACFQTAHCCLSFSRMMAPKTLPCIFGLASIVSAQFGFAEESDSFVVNAGSADTLVTTIRKSDCDIRSLVYRGTELQGPQDQGTHIGSGLGSANVTAETIDGMSLPQIISAYDRVLISPQTNMSKSHAVPVP